MKYHIFMKTRLGHYKEIGQTVYLEDAKRILENWHEGYIADNFEEVLIKKDNKEKN